MTEEADPRCSPNFLFVVSFLSAFGRDPLKVEWTLSSFVDGLLAKDSLFHDQMRQVLRRLLSSSGRPIPASEPKDVDARMQKIIWKALEDPSNPAFHHVKWCFPDGWGEEDIPRWSPSKKLNLVMFLIFQAVASGQPSLRRASQNLSDTLGFAMMRRGGGDTLVGLDKKGMRYWLLQDEAKGLLLLREERRSLSRLSSSAVTGAEREGRMEVLAENLDDLKKVAVYLSEDVHQTRLHRERSLRTQRRDALIQEGGQGGPDPPSTSDPKEVPKPPPSSSLVSVVGEEDTSWFPYGFDGCSGYQFTEEGVGMTAEDSQLDLSKSLEAWKEEIERRRRKEQSQMRQRAVALKHEMVESSNTFSSGRRERKVVNYAELDRRADEEAGLRPRRALADSSDSEAPRKSRRLRGVSVDEEETAQSKEEQRRLREERALRRRGNLPPLPEHDFLEDDEEEAKEGSSGEEEEEEEEAYEASEKSEEGGEAEEESDFLSDEPGVPREKPTAEQREERDTRHRRRLMGGGGGGDPFAPPPSLPQEFLSTSRRRKVVEEDEEEDDQAGGISSPDSLLMR